MFFMQMVSSNALDDFSQCVQEIPFVNRIGGSLESNTAVDILTSWTSIGVASSTSYQVRELNDLCSFLLCIDFNMNYSLHYASPTKPLRLALMLTSPIRSRLLRFLAPCLTQARLALARSSTKLSMSRH